jgi:hypothetical protein
MNLMNNDNHESRSNPWAMGVAITGGFLAALLRIVPHPPNFSAVGGLGIFGGARLSGWQAYLLPLAIMVLSDLCLWVVTGFDVKYSLADLNRIPVYASFMIYVAIGRWFLQHRTSMASIWLAATIGGVQFFVISNFFDWLVQPYQPYYDSIHEFFRYSAGNASDRTSADGIDLIPGVDAGVDDPRGYPVHNHLSLRICPLGATQP